MKTHKLKLTENEMNLVRWAVGKLLQSIDNDMRPWTDIDEEPPEFLQEQFVEVEQLYRNLTDPF